jgi:hypothetical protein
MLPCRVQTTVPSLTRTDSRLRDGPQLKVSIRLAEHGGLIYLDLMDEFWRCVEIGTNEWRMAEDPPVRFATAPACSHTSASGVNQLTRSRRFEVLVVT